MRERCGWVAAAVTAALLMAGTADAKTFNVTRTSDPNPGKCKPNDCSLREAVLAANERAGKDVIVLPNRKQAYGLTRTGAGEDAGRTGDLDVNNDPLFIRHLGKGRATIDAQGIDRVLHIQAGAPTTLKRIVVSGGDSGSDGGGILTTANLKLQSSVVAANRGDDGGGIDLDSNADLLMSRSVARNNRAADDDASDGGAINTAADNSVVRILRSKIIGNRSRGHGGGIAVVLNGDAQIKKSTIAGNSSVTDGGGGISADDPDSVVNVSSSTISGNIADGPTAGSGGGILVTDAQVNVENSTVAGNRAFLKGGGVYIEGAGRVSLNAASVVRNAADYTNISPPRQGGGLQNQNSTGFELRNSLVALNRSGADRNDCEGNSFVSQGNNLLSTDNGGECEGFNAAGDLVRANPKVRPLRHNGGPTQTVALKKGSPAIGKAHKASAPSRDQRGRKRDSKPDIGAYERGA